MPVTTGPREDPARQLISSVSSTVVEYLNFVVELATYEETWTRMKQVHTPTPEGFCSARICAKGGTGIASMPWPCVTRRLADWAAWIHGRSSGVGGSTAARRPTRPGGARALWRVAALGVGPRRQNAAMRSRTNGMWWGPAIEAPDPVALAGFYAELLGWPVVHQEPGTAVVASAPDGPYMVFQEAAGYRAPVWPRVEGEQRPMMHLDFQVGDLDDAVAEALALGASLASSQPKETSGCCSTRPATRSASAARWRSSRSVGVRRGRGVVGVVLAEAWCPRSPGVGGATRRRAATTVLVLRGRLGGVGQRPARTARDAPPQPRAERAARSASPVGPRRHSLAWVPGSPGGAEPTEPPRPTGAGRAVSRPVRRGRPGRGAGRAGGAFQAAAACGGRPRWTARSRWSSGPPCGSG